MKSQSKIECDLLEIMHSIATVNLKTPEIQLCTH